MFVSVSLWFVGIRVYTTHHMYTQTKLCVAVVVVVVLDGCVCVWLLASVVCMLVVV